MLESDMRSLPYPTLVPASEANGRHPERPRGFYRILDAPVPLAGCEIPLDFVRFDQLHEAGFRRVYCLCAESPRYSPAPLKLAIACDLDDLSYREFPRKPREEEVRIESIAVDIVSALSRGEGCLVHCAAGRGRTGSVIGVVLRKLGVPADVVIQHLDSVHQFRNGASWPESPWQAALVSRGNRLDLQAPTHGNRRQ